MPEIQQIAPPSYEVLMELVQYREAQIKKLEYDLMDAQARLKSYLGVLMALIKLNDGKPLEISTALIQALTLGDAIETKLVGEKVVLSLTTITEAQADRAGVVRRQLEITLPKKRPCTVRIEDPGFEILDSLEAKTQEGLALVRTLRKPEGFRQFQSNKEFYHFSSDLSEKTVHLTYYARAAS